MQISTDFAYQVVPTGRTGAIAPVEPVTPARPTNRDDGRAPLPQRLPDASIEPELRRVVEPVMLPNATLATQRALALYQDTASLSEPAAQRKGLVLDVLL